MANYYQQISGGINDRQEQLRRIQMEKDALAKQKAMEGQRQNILRQYFQPAVPERQEMETVENPLARIMAEPKPQMEMSPVEGQQSWAPERAPQSPLMATETQMKTIPGKEAVFDPRGAMGALFGIGDMDTAKSIADIEYKQNLMNGGQEKYGMSGRLIKLPDGSIVERQYSNRGGYKDTPVSGELIGQLDKVNLGGVQQLVNPYTGEVVREESVSATPYQQFQMSPTSQANVAGAVEKAKVTEKAAAEKSGEDLKKTAGIDDQLRLVDQMKEIVQSGGGFLGSSLKDQGTYAFIQKTGKDSDNLAYNNTKKLALIANRLLLGAKPEGSGNPTPSEWEMFGKTIADPSQYPDAKSFLSAVETYKQVLEGSKPLPAQFRQSRPAAAPRPSAQAAAKPKTGERRGDYMFLGGDPADRNRWRKVK